MPAAVVARLAFLLGCLVALAACGSEPTARAEQRVNDPVSPTAAAVPFAVRGDLSGLMLTWFDAEGTHLAAARDQIPEARRQEVRVDSLALSPEERDPDQVFVADLRAAGPDGRYAVARVGRAEFDARVDGARQQAAVAVAPVAPIAPVAPGVAPAPGAPSSGDVVVFGASWCGACRQTEAFLRQRGVPFVERDIEREPGAREEMRRRAAAAGRSPRGIPVIDFRGHILEGFDARALDRLIRETSATPAPAPAPGTSI